MKNEGIRFRAWSIWINLIFGIILLFFNFIVFINYYLGYLNSPLRDILISVAYSISYIFMYPLAAIALVILPLFNFISIIYFISKKNKKDSIMAILFTLFSGITIYLGIIGTFFGGGKWVELVGMIFYVILIFLALYYKWRE